jgi:hypothetical protein
MEGVLGLETSERLEGIVKSERGQEVHSKVYWCENTHNRQRITSHVPLITYVYAIELLASGEVPLAHKICREERSEASLHGRGLTHYLMQSQAQEIWQEKKKFQ